MATEIFSRSTFDPRRHSAVAIAISEKQPNWQGKKGEEVSVKHYQVGPNVPPPGLSLRRPITAPVHRKLPTGQLDPNPKFLNQNGKWVQEEIPALIAESQAQPLTATSTFTATLPNSGAYRSVRPVTAVHTYNDISPVIAADMTYDIDSESTLLKESLVNRPRSAVPVNSVRAAQQSAAAATIKAIHKLNNPTVNVEVEAPDARKKSIDSFWARQAGTAFTLTGDDLLRVKELGKPIPPESPNTRLVGSRWRYIERPADGDVVYTDYYGRCGTELNAYYGRAYHVAPAQFRSSRLVSDLDYLRVQASMPGINALRTRPGLVLDSTIVNGPAEKLSGLTVSKAKTARGLHRLNEYARMMPAGERDIRQVWQN